MAKQIEAEAKRERLGFERDKLEARSAAAQAASASAAGIEATGDEAELEARYWRIARTADKPEVELKALDSLRDMRGLRGLDPDGVGRAIDTMERLQDARRRREAEIPEPRPPDAS